MLFWREKHSLLVFERKSLFFKRYNSSKKKLLIIILYSATEPGLEK